MRAARFLNGVVVSAALLILVIVLLSFSLASYLKFPPPGFSLRWYQSYLGSRDWLESTGLSLEMAVVVVVLSTVLGTLAALGLARLPPG